MAKSKDIKGLIEKKAPGGLRHAVSKVNILQEAAAALTSDPEEKETDKSDEQIQSSIEVDKADEQSQSVKESGKSEGKEDTKESVPSLEVKKRSSKPRQENVRTTRSNSRRKPKVFSSKDVHAVLELGKRQTERYSFEIYSDQKEDIQQICDLYEKATGSKLSASRLIREVLDTFLPDAMKTFEAASKESHEE